MSNTLTIDDLSEMSNIKMSKDVKKSKRCQQTVNLYEVTLGWSGEVAWGGRGEVAWGGRVRWPGMGWEG